MSLARPAVFLDRDGVLNRAVVKAGKPYPPGRIEDLEILPGVASACRELRDAGFDLVVVTNQPDIARGTLTHAAIESFHNRLKAELPIDHWEVCPHDDSDRCGCRKPEPGLIERAAERLGLDLSRSVVVGDRWRDIEAGQRAGCRTVFLDYGYTEQRPTGQNHTSRTLLAAKDWIIKSVTNGRNVMKMPLDWNIGIFADGADLPSILKLAGDPLIKGFTTNPTLMRQAGIRDYEGFSRELLSHIADRPVSFEVFSDELSEMYTQARQIASWGANVFVKIPVSNTVGVSTEPLVKALSAEGVQLNVTALMTLAQVETVSAALAGGPPAFVSVFAGRIADTGRDPVPIMAAAVECLRPYPNQQLIWASPRELLNLIQADSIGCHVITVTPDLLKKITLVGKDLDEYSLDTVRMFRRDAEAAGFRLSTIETSGLAVLAEAIQNEQTLVLSPKEEAVTR